MCLLKEMDFKTINGFRENQWTNLFLGMDEECIAALEIGRFKLYFDVMGNADIRKDSRRWDAQAIQMSPDLLDKIEETNAMDMDDALERLYGYRWEEEVFITPTFDVENGTETNVYPLEWGETYIHSSLWIKLEAIRLLKRAMVQHPHAVEDDEVERLLELNEIRGLAYPLQKGLSKERIERKIQHAIEREEDLMNHLKYIECDSDGHFLTVIWQSDNDLVHNRMQTLMAQWAE